jgi:hypothetical protein
MAGDFELILVATAIILGLLALPLLFPSGRAFLARVVLGKAEQVSDGADEDEAPALKPIARAEDSGPNPP